MVMRLMNSKHFVELHLHNNSYWTLIWCQEFRCHKGTMFWIAHLALGVFGQATQKSLYCLPSSAWANQMRAPMPSVFSWQLSVAPRTGEERSAEYWAKFCFTLTSENCFMGNEPSTGSTSHVKVSSLSAVLGRKVFLRYKAWSCFTGHLATLDLTLQPFLLTY